MGANPVRVLRGRPGSSEEVRTVQERVVVGGKQDIVAASRKLLPSVVKITSSLGPGGDAIGSGIIYRSDGYIITNNHVVEGALSISVSDCDVCASYDATLIGANAAMDVAVIKIDASGLRAATIGSSANLVPGQAAIAIGTPEGFTRSVTTGIISGINRNLSGGTVQMANAIQTDAAINPGNSGGPLADISGNVVGINTAIVSQSGGSEGLGFAIPIDAAKPVIDQLIATAPGR
jgi:S1-C subfamily serine protease